jgi:hemin uptake protein HemP
MSSERQTPGQGQETERTQTAASNLPRIDVRMLLGPGREALLIHGTMEYRLRLTSNGKLILTK